jgi:hypothetical protein
MGAVVKKGNTSAHIPIPRAASNALVKFPHDIWIELVMAVIFKRLSL